MAARAQPPPPLRIAVLEFDTPLPAAAGAPCGGYCAAFRALLAAGAAALRGEREGVQEVNGCGDDNDSGVCSVSKQVSVDVWCADVKTDVNAYPALADVDAVLISGSKHDAFSDAPWVLRLVEWTRGVLLSQSRVRVLGVCFGHQIVGRALGAPVRRSAAGWELSVSPFTTSAAGRALFGGREKLMHRDVVVCCPDGIDSLGSSPACDVQGMHARARLLTVQGHPEFDARIASRLLKEGLRAGTFGEALYTSGVTRVGRPHDGLVVAEAFLRFLLDEG